MNFRVIYIRHNCFVLHLGDDTLLFDPPSDEHLGNEGRIALERAIHGRDLTVFVSHSHKDHCHPELDRLVFRAGRAKFVLSYDVEELSPENVPSGSLIVEPDQDVVLGRMRITTLESNDMGVAFLIDGGGRRMYFGGDLADWCWEDAPAAAKAFTARFFENALDRIAEFKPSIGFSNADPRIPCFGGAYRFVQKVRPGLFVPMHAFGRPGDLRPLLAELAQRQPEQRVFRYQQSGEVMDVEGIG